MHAASRARPTTKRHAPRSERTSRRGDASDVLGGVRVMVVEDDAASRKLAMLLLAAAGAVPTGAGSAEEALAAIAVERPDVAIVDLVLPRMSGLALIEELGRRPETRGIVIVAVTSLMGRDVERLVRAAGCVAYVAKPIDAESFVATIAACLGGKR
jgi:two-component system cell cycle response regulator DivK